MTYRAMFAYAWDLAEDLPGITGELRDLGLDTITFAGAYHAGKFLRPHGRGGKVYFPEDGTAYFRADPARYGAIKPQVSRVTAETDPHGGAPARGYRNWTQHPNNPMAKTSKLAEPAE